MDQEIFDLISRRFASRLNRRTLAGVAVLSLAAVTTQASNVDAKKKKKKKKKKPTTPPPTTCKPDAAATTCAGKCGSVSNNCQQQVNCGACTGCSGVAPTTDLQAAVDATGTGATLTLCEGTWTPSTWVEISRDMTIRGAGKGKTILDGRNLVPLLFIDQNTVVTVENLTITNGKNTSGGGIYIFGGKLHLRDAEVASCKATYDGGGGVLNNGTLEMHEGAVIRDNTSTYNGGGISNIGKLTMHSGSRILGNVAGTDGGGIDNFASAIVLESGSQISGNRAVNGGGISTSGSTSSVVLKSGSVIGGSQPADANVATSYGGGIQGENVTLESGSKVIGNQADEGGGCHFQGGVALQTGSVITGNSARTAGAIYAYSSDDVVLESDVIICDNLPLTDQCVHVDGSCPSSSDGICRP